MECADHINHYQLDAELFDYFDEGTGATRDFDRRLKAYILSLCNVKPGCRVLDLGSGSGWVARKLGPKKVQIVSVDLARKNLARIKEGLVQGSADFVLADAYHLPFRNGSFDLIVASEILEHLDSAVEALHEVRRILLPGGKIIASTPYKEKIRYYLCIHCNKKTPANAHLHSFDELSLSSLFQSQNFRQIRFYKLGNKLLLYSRLYYLLRFLPFGVWKALDRVANLILPKPAYIVSIAE